MQKFIHDNFELDLSNYQINRVEENQWFSDQFFTKYTFPFELKLTDEINAFFGLISDYNIEEPLTVYKGVLFIDNIHEEAVLEVLELQGKIATIEISYGFDSFPNWEKKLSELPLQKTTLGESLFDHAENIIDKTWPEVNYNFVQVHTDSFDPGDDRWTGFEKIINNYKDGAFLVNEFDDIDSITYNRNIMIPMPYVMHVLKQGFLDAGYGLKGDVVTDPEINKMLFFRETEEYVNARIEGEEIVLPTNMSHTNVTKEYKYGTWPFMVKVHTTLGVYNHEYTFPKKGKYKIAGNIYMRRQRSDSRANMYFKGERIWDKYEDAFGVKNKNYSEKVKGVDLEIYVNNLSDKLVIQIQQIAYSIVNDLKVIDGPLIDLTITPLAIYDEFGFLIPPIITTSKLDLTKCVPDANFGELVTTIKNWKNMDLKIDGGDVYMNYIEPQLDVQQAIDLRQYNTEEPRRKFKQGDSFVLQFKELDNENYKPAALFVDINGEQLDGFSVGEKTSEITINAIPLPNIFRNGVTTSLAVDKGDSSMCIVLYSGSASLNVAEDNAPIMIPAVHVAHWQKWLAFRIKSQSFESVFKAFGHELLGLNTSSKVVMYNNYHLIRSMSKTNIPGTDIFEVELELEKLK